MLAALASTLAAAKADDEGLPSRKKRPYVKRSKTGCLTCRARKVRCDEGKPSCRRCLDTGRSCDGYALSSSVTTSGLAQEPINSKYAARGFCVRPTVSSGTAPDTKSPRVKLPKKHTTLHPASELKLAIPRKDPSQVRSFTFFLEVAAPALAGLFDVELWLREIPRASHADPAVWHAVVCLGAAYEAYAAPLTPSSSSSSSSSSRDLRREAFVLQQFNSSVRALVDTTAAHANKWRALTLSALFTCICTIRGQHPEALIHLRSGCNLLHELQVDEKRREGKAQESSSVAGPLPLWGKQDQATKRRVPAPSVPVSLGPIKSFFINLATQAAALDNGGLVSTPDLVAENEHFNVWRYYQGPQEGVAGVADTPTRQSSSTLSPLSTSGFSSTSSSAPPASAFASSSTTPSSPLTSYSSSPSSCPPTAPPLPTGYLNQTNLLWANRAAESLSDAITYFYQQNVFDIMALNKTDTPDPAILERLVVRSEPLTRCYVEINKALRIFEAELEQMPPPSQKRQASLKGVLALALCQATTGLALMRGPDEPENKGRPIRCPERFAEIVNLGERILQLDAGRGWGSFTAGSSTTGPLSFAATYGLPQKTRRRAVELLKKYPRQEGFFDSLMAASVAEAVMALEQEVMKGEIQEKGEEMSGVDEDLEVPKMNRIFNMTTSWKGDKSAVVTLRTWGDKIHGRPPVQRVIYW